MLGRRRFPLRAASQERLIVVLLPKSTFFTTVQQEHHHASSLPGLGPPATRIEQIPKKWVPGSLSLGVFN